MNREKTVEIIEYYASDNQEYWLYEKYGYSFCKIMKDIHGEDSRVYRINVQKDYMKKWVKSRTTES